MARLLKMKYKLMRVQYSRFELDRRQYVLKRRLEKERFLGALYNKKLRNRRKSITIEGIRYNSSPLKLQRKPSPRGGVGMSAIVRVRGETFEVGSCGKTLRRVGGGPSKLNKVYLGGVAFIKSRNNDATLQRSNTHVIQQRLIQAKQRSIAHLSKRLRKNNEPCPIYHRFGKCSGKEKGTCNRVHDPKLITVCKKFLQGACDKKDCLLSHDVGLSKMPTCRHYLAGMCSRDNCPYLHVKLNSSAPICRSFLQGYCPDADKCKRRHIDICPEFEATAKCSKGKSCPYPHPKNHHRTVTMKIGTRNTGPKPITKRKNTDNEESKCDVIVNVPPPRYYSVQDSSKDEPIQDTTEQLSLDDANKDDLRCGWLHKRPKLGNLPGFIPLDKEIC